MVGRIISSGFSLSSVYNHLNIALLSGVVFLGVFAPGVKDHFNVLILLISLFLIFNCLRRVYDDLRFLYCARMHSYFGIDDDHWSEMDMEERRGLMSAYYDGLRRDACQSVIDYNFNLNSSSRGTWHSRHVSLLASKFIKGLDQKYDMI